PQAVAMSFNGLTAVVKSCSDNEIVTEVPAGASTGILLISCSGSEKSAGIFAVQDAGMSIAPQFGPPGTVVELTGKDFGTDPAQGSVRVNGQLANIVSWADTTIRFRVPHASTAGVVTVSLRGREKTAGLFRVTRLFNISSAKATTGSLLTITGEGWGSAQADSALVFSPAVNAEIKSWTDAKIVFSVPPGAGSGALNATVSDVTFRVADFTINAISSVTPDRGIAGDELTISGIGFGADATNGYVTIGDVRPEILSWADTSIRIRIPAGTRPGNLMVRAGDIDSNTVPVVITAITSISYVRRPAGASLTVNGYGFGNNTGFLLFGAVVAVDFTIWNDTRIDAVIPESATGSVALVVSSLGVRSPAVPFDVTWIDGLDTSEGWPGRELVVSGNNLGDGAGNDRVTINGVVAPIISWSKREIHLRVPAGTTTGPLVLTLSDWPIEITDEFTVYNSYDYRQLAPDWSGRRANSRPLLPGLVEDAAGNQFITDYDNGWVWKIAADGRQSKFGNLARPWGIAISPINNRLFVSESGNNCLQVFDTDGNHLETIGTSGSGDGQLKGPRGLAFDGAGRLYIADAGNSRVNVFATKPAIVYLTSFGTSGSANGQLVNPSGVAVDSLLNVYVADAGNHRVQRFTPDSAVTPVAWSFSGWVGSRDPNALTPGWLIAGSGLPSSADGGFYNPYGLGLAGDGRLLVADSDNNRVQVINTLTGTFAGQIGAAGTTSGQYNQPLAVYYKNDCISIADSSNARVQRSTLAGEFISQIIPDTSLLNTRPGRVTVDSTRRRVYVLDIDDGSITVFGFDGQVMQIIGSKGSGNGQFYKPEGLCVDLNGNLFVADTGNARIQIFSPEGLFIKAWGVYGTGASQFISPNALAVSADGAHIFVVDAKQNRVQKFTRDGIFVKTWGSYGAADDHFAAPSGIAADHKGFLYIADQNNHRIKKYNTDGRLIGWWGSYDAGAQAFWLDPGSQRSGAVSDADGAFDSPTDVTVDSQGNVLVADSGNFRIQRFAADQSSGSAAGWQGEIYTGENLAALAVDNWATVYTIPVGGGLVRFAPDL
ncbi:MAG TPA: IPT/TIG domain-containing protein, partial [Candidatus Rifleibacterium sp.]|nr:IPT/TIG domain-containing protein [Candidatus Rifleibacterium sp.]